MTHIYGCRISSAKATLIGGADQVLTAPGDFSDLRPLCTYIDDQIGERCVGEAITEAHWGYQIQNGGTKHGSPHGVHTAARVRERARVTDGIIDVGCDPADAFDAMVATGMYPHDANDDDASAANKLETWSEAMGLLKFQPSDFTPIDDADVYTAEAFLCQKVLVVAWSLVNRTYENLGASEVWRGITPSDPAVGGHARVLCGHDRATNRMREWGSWGTGYGEGGFNWVSRDVYLSGAVHMVAIHGGPIFP